MAALAGDAVSQPGAGKAALAGSFQIRNQKYGNLLRPEEANSADGTRIVLYPAQSAGSAACGDCDGNGGVDARLLERFWGRLDLRRRLDVHHDELNGQRGRLQTVTHFMGDFMAAPHGQVAVHFHVEFHQ